MAKVKASESAKKTPNFGKLSTKKLQERLSEDGLSKSDRSAINAIIKERENAKPKEEIIVSFKDRHGGELIKGPAVSITVGKQDGNTYYGVRVGDKIKYAQEKRVTFHSGPKKGQKPVEEVKAVKKEAKKAAPKKAAKKAAPKKAVKAEVPVEQAENESI